MGIRIKQFKENPSDAWSFMVCLNRPSQKDPKSAALARVVMLADRCLISEAFPAVDHQIIRLFVRYIFSLI